ncbi:DUF4112 domain-containing protein [Phenylobacterium sp. J426]|uniref:DUF4112 domain-containing protein n=1 Tax=Phenylobacterium sp. J426 TaxID=2898439 RepID=UPI002151D6DC|nr:DUF4112 domain-containing protein [Phenylobacterium sp. J426]MCR5876320.1 DUF4112 domain-containing protein [Phenylobacterium sp. J426]
MEENRAHTAWRRAERIRVLSDRMLGIGPFGIGIDGVLAWVPVAGTAYSVGAGALLFSEAIQAGASRATLVKMALYLGVDTASSSVPLAGWAVDTLFPGHAMAAKALQKDIERRHGRPVNLDDEALRASRARPVGPRAVR